MLRYRHIQRYRGRRRRYESPLLGSVCDDLRPPRSTSSPPSPPFNPPFAHVLPSTDDGEGEEDEEREFNGCELRKNGGWFPASYTKPPTPEQLLHYQERQGGSVAANDALAPPEYWMASQCGLDDDTVGATLYDVEQTSEEWEAVEKDFNAGIYQMQGNNRPNGEALKIVKMQRIENMNLWQSYAAKVNSRGVYYHPFRLSINSNDS